MTLIKNMLTFVVITLFMICIGITISTEMTFATTNQSETESNNTFGSADRIDITSNHSFSGNLSTGNDTDFVVFTVPQGSVINMKVSFFTNCSFPYEIYNASNMEDYAYWNCAEYNSNFGYAYRNDTLCLSQGTYYMKLNVNDFVTKKRDYMFVFSLTPYESFKEPNNTIGSATSLSCAKEYKGVLASDEDHDVFKYTSSVGGYYYFTLMNYNVGWGIIARSVDSNGEYRSLFNRTSIQPTGSELFKVGRTTQLVKLPVGATYFNLFAQEIEFDEGQYRLSVTAKPSKVSKVKASKYSSTSIKVKWKKKSSVSGYKVYRSTHKNSSYKLIKTLSGASKCYYIDKKKKKKKTYYYRVVAYKIVNGYTCIGYYSSKVAKRL